MPRCLNGGQRTTFQIVSVRLLRNALIKIDFRREKANDGKHWESDQKAVLDARPS